MFKRLIKKIIGLSTPNQVINLRKTLIFNYLAFGIKGIIIRPVLIYGDTKIYKVGKIIIKSPLKKGIMTIGKFNFKSQGVTKFLNDGTIIIEGPVHIEGCTIINNLGQIVFKGYNRIADGSQLFIRSYLEYGQHSRLGFHSMIMDSDDHYLIDTETHFVNRFSKPIIIGKYNFIGNSTIIKKGVKTPDYLIVASPNALLTKDYTTLLPKYAVIGGSPAKVLKTGVRRIFNDAEEARLKDFFNKNPQLTQVHIDIEDSQLDNYCMNTQNF